MYLERMLHLTSRMLDDPNRERRMEVVAEARTWIDTPFRHQGSRKGHGCDCIGFLRRIGTDMDLCTEDLWGPKAAPFEGYSELPDPDKFMAALNIFMDEISLKDILYADIILFQSRVNPTHLGLVTDEGMIHGYLKTKKVVEHSLDTMWFRHIKTVYRFPVFASR